MGGAEHAAGMVLGDAAAGEVDVIPADVLPLSATIIAMQELPDASAVEYRLSNSMKVCYSQSESKPWLACAPGAN